MSVCRICESKLLPVPGDGRPHQGWFCPKCRLVYYLGPMVEKGPVSIEPGKKE
jgi:hypothetical protein